MQAVVPARELAVDTQNEERMAFHMKKIPVGYGLNECPPIKETIPLSLQHILILIFNVLPVPLLIGGGVGLSTAEITILVAGCLLVTGIATVVQSLGVGPIGARLPICLENSFVFVAPGIALGMQYGLDTFTGACLVGSVVTVVLWAAFHKQLSNLFKPYITGAVVMALGLSLFSVGIDYCAGGSGAADYGDPINLVLAFGTILIMLVLTGAQSLWAEELPVQGVPAHRNPGHVGRGGDVWQAGPVVHRFGELGARAAAAALWHPV